MKIRVAFKGGLPIASILTIRHKDTLVYKYGCSDGQYSNLGGTPLLFWKVIQQAKESALELFDLGRSTSEDAGLIAFKDHLGAVSTRLTYYRNPMRHRGKSSSSPLSFASAWGREALGRLPDPLLAGIGQLLYRHIG